MLECECYQYFGVLSTSWSSWPLSSEALQQSESKVGQSWCSPCRATWLLAEEASPPHTVLSYAQISLPLIYPLWPNISTLYKAGAESHSSCFYCSHVHFLSSPELMNHSSALQEHGRRSRHGENRCTSQEHRNDFLLENSCRDVSYSQNTCIKRLIYWCIDISDCVREQKS